MGRVVAGGGDEGAAEVAQGLHFVLVEPVAVAKVERDAEDAALGFGRDFEDEDAGVLEQAQEAVVEGGEIPEHGGGGAGGSGVVRGGPTEATGGADLTGSELAFRFDTAFGPGLGQTIAAGEPVEAGDGDAAEVAGGCAGAGDVEEVRRAVADLEEALGAGADAAAGGVEEGVRLRLLGVEGAALEDRDEVTQEGRGAAGPFVLASEESAEDHCWWESVAPAQQRRG